MPSGEKRQRITKPQPKPLPTTGNGRTGGQKPKLSETNLPGSGKTSWVARLIRRSTPGGRHS